MRGAVKESAVLPAFFQITLGFEDLHHGHDRGVSDFAALKEDFIDITDGRSAALPDELHDFELLRGKRVVFGTHSKYLVLINSYVKGKSKPPRGSPGGMTGGTGRVDCFGVRLAISLSVSPSATQRDESTSARGLRAAARFPRPQRPWVFFVPLARQRCRRSLLVALQNRSEEHTSELQSRLHLVCRLLLEKKKTNRRSSYSPLTRQT